MVLVIYGNIGKKQRLRFNLLKTDYKILISEAQIRSAVSACGERISREYEGKPLLIIGMLKGAFIFTADLLRAVKIPARVDFIKTRSYTDGKNRGELKVDFDESINFSDYHVIITEDIIDSGHTLKAVTAMIREKSPKSLEVIALLDKPTGRETDFNDFEALFTVGDEFVVGYGLDMDESGRGLPFIASV
jgi:hypoxanthine phosphoribosyltransferase